MGWEDAAVDPLRLGDYLREFQALVDRYDYKTSLYGHFGDGCIHARINFDLRSRAGIATWRDFLREAAELVVKYGGSLSGEHGDGQAKAEFLPVMFGTELMQAFREFKAHLGPARQNESRQADRCLSRGRKPAARSRLQSGAAGHAFRVSSHLKAAALRARSSTASAWANAAARTA